MYMFVFMLYNFNICLPFYLSSYPYLNMDHERFLKLFKELKCNKKRYRWFCDCCLNQFTFFNVGKGGGFHS